MHHAIFHNNVTFCHLKKLLEYVVNNLKMHFWKHCEKRLDFIYKQNQCLFYFNFFFQRWIWRNSNCWIANVFQQLKTGENKLEKTLLSLNSCQFSNKKLYQNHGCGVSKTVLLFKHNIQMLLHVLPWFSYALKSWDSRIKNRFPISKKEECWTFQALAKYARIFTVKEKNNHANAVLYEQFYDEFV